MMMTISSNPTVQVPPWDLYFEDPTANIHSPFSVSPSDDLTALQRYLPSNVDVAAAIAAAAEDDEDDGDIDFPADVYSCDHFRMYEFKVRRCARGRSHDWTECPFAHPGEKARRRDPRKVHYSGTPCPEFRKGQCKKGDGCEFAHGVFECWLHPSRYRTQPCKDGTQCRRRVCFFAHTPDQLRVLPNSPKNVAASESYDGSPSRLAMDSFFTKGGGSLYSPPCSPPSESPPMSPGLNSAVSAELASSIRNLQIGSSNVTRMNIRPGFCSPRSPSTLRPGFMSLPATPARSGPRVFDLWEGGRSFEEEPVMERVESGRELRAKIYSKLSKENSLARGNPSGQGPDLDWVSELVN